MHIKNDKLVLVLFAMLGLTLCTSKKADPYRQNTAPSELARRQADINALAASTESMMIADLARFNHQYHMTRRVLEIRAPRKPTIIDRALDNPEFWIEKRPEIVQDTIHY